MRAEHGHPEPYGVKYWHVYAWGDMDAETHARDFRKFATVARLIDPGIQVIGSAVGGSKWASTVFETLDRVNTPALGGIGLIDHMAFMHYFGVLTEDVDYTDAEYYRILHNAAGLEGRLREYDTTLRFYSQRRTPWAQNWLDDANLDQVATPETMGIVMTEWAVNWASRRCTMRDAITAAGVLDTYHLFQMYKPHRNNDSLAVEVECDHLATDQSDGETDFFASATVKRDATLPMVTASASIDRGNGELIVSATNRHLTDAIDVEISLEGVGQPTSGTKTLLSSDGVRDFNDAENPQRITPLESDYTAGGRGMPARAASLFNFDSEIEIDRMTGATLPLGVGRAAFGFCARYSATGSSSVCSSTPIASAMI